MTLWAPVFALATFGAAFFGFGGPTGPAQGFAQFLFFVCLIAVMVSVVLASAKRASR